MTDIICRWLNDDVKISLNIEKQNVSQRFSSGYLFGEILYKYGLQDDFSSFSEGRTADSKLNNFTRIEPVMKLLEIPYDTNVAKSIMNENHGAATKLLYQLFIALGRKAKKNLTGVVMETMRPSAPVKLESIESSMHKERLKQLVPRQVDVNFETLVEKYQNKQRLQEEMVVRAKQEEERKVRQFQQDLRQRGLEKSRTVRDKQNEVMQKIRDAQVRIPKPPESKKSAKSKQDSRKEREIQEVKDHISSFEESLRTNLPQFDSEMEGMQDVESRLPRKPLEPILLKTAGDDYVSKIKKRLNEDAVARKEREKRRRRVLIEQLKAHEAQEEQRREEMLVKRLMRQSQQEKRIAVQLMQIRHEKQVIKENRIFREKQYAERRLKDFEDALNREAEMCRLAQIEYRDQIKKTKDEREQLLEEKRKQKYGKHYNICQQILSDIVDLSCKIGEYRELTEGNVPEKLFREWKGYFDASLPLYPYEILTEEEIKRSQELLVAKEKNKLTDESDFIEYRGAVGEWEPTDESFDHVPPKDNPILGHIVQKLFNIISPAEPPPPTPEFPPFPIKACFLGKFFSGKTTAVQRLVASHRVVRLCIDDLVQDAIEAYKTGDTREEIIENEEPQNERCLEDKPSVQAQETTISDQADQSRDETKENEDPNNATAPVNTEVRDCGDVTRNGNGLEENKKSYSVVRKVTSRAILGEKAYEYLKKGKQIQDQLLVDISVEAIRQVPAGTGWILDGFPLTVNQAKILEKSLTGYDASKEVKTKETKGRGKKSRIAPDLHPVVESPPPKSGIDIVVLFDVSDDVVLTRAEGRTYNPTNNEIFHQEFNPPVDGSYTGLGKQEKVRPVTDPSNDREQVQQRITGFDDSWSKLEKWFNKFGILNKVDVDNSIDDVYECVASLLVKTTERIQGPIIEDISEEVTSTSKEVTESTSVNDFVDNVNTDEPTDAMTHEDVEDTKETLNTKTVSPKASKKMSKKDRSPSPPSKAVSPKSSKKNLRPGSKRGSPSPSRKPSKVKSPTASRTDTKRVKSPVKKQEVPEELPVEPVVPPGPEPGSKEWEYVNQPIEMPFVQILASRWENLEKTYIDTAKDVFREIRLEREVICRYFYSTRKEFLSFLRRPDEKEEYVLQWQNHYNDVAEDMRSDDEVKAELHQEVDDLCDRLYSICDNRKEMAENERTIVMEEGWLQDRLGLLTNHYLTLMQVEVDRYQDTYRVLKDYYNSAEGKNPIEAYSDICRVPLVDLPPIVPTIPSSGSEHGSQHEVKQTSSKKDRENIKTPEGPTSEGEDHRSRIPLVPRRPKSGDVASTKEKKDKRSSKEKRDKGDNQSETPVLPSDPDERLVFDGYYHALGIIDILANLDQAEQEEEANKMAETLKEKEKDKEKDSGKKGGGKDKKVEKKGKKSANKSKQETPPPAPPTNEGENEEEKLKKEMKEKARKEFLASVQFEDTALRIRLEMMRNRSVAVLQELKMKADLTYKDMDDWLGARFLQEVDSIRAMADLARTGIENEQKLQQQLILEDKEFVVDLDVNVFRTASPTPPPSPKEQTSSDHFTVVHLEHLYSQFVYAAPSGLISCRAFVDIFLDLMTTSFGMEMLPDVWISQTGLQLHSLTTIISEDSEFVDWKKFLVLTSSPLPMPSRDEIFDTLSRFMEIDVEKTGFVSEKQFLQLHLWFSDHYEDEDDSTFPRLKHLKQLLFKIFSDSRKGSSVLNYENFLLYFAMDENAIEGILRAFTVVCGQLMPSSSLFHTKETLTETGTSFPVSNSISDEPGGNALITLKDLVKVFHHGGNEFSEKQRFQGAEYSAKTFSKDRLSGVFTELGATETESLPFSVLYQHPIIEDCIHTCQIYKYHNISNLLKSERLDISINEGQQ